jgi:hypothetical protein
VLEDRAHELGPDQRRQVVVDDHPLVVPGRRSAGGVEDVGLGDAAIPGQIDEPVVGPDHRDVELRDEQMDVVARVADQCEALGVAWEVGLLAFVVSAEQQHRRVVAPVEVRAPDLAGPVQALEVRPGAAKVDGIGQLGAPGQGAAVRGDVVGDELPEQRPPGGGLDRVVAILASVADPSRGTERPKHLLGPG